ncbi:ParB/RepB/Spo0J family partition protein [Chloroflexota bacterium]
MILRDISIKALREAPWNPNEMDETMLIRLKESLKRYGLVTNLVVRQISEDVYEVISGNQRLVALKEAGYTDVPCAVIDLDDARARLLAQALNHIHGEDDLGLRAKLISEVLHTMGESEVAALLPETTSSLRAIVSMDRESIADYLRSWEQARSGRLQALRFRLITGQMEVVMEAIARILPQVSRTECDSPNVRGTALYLLCKSYLEREVHDH